MNTHLPSDQWQVTSDRKKSLALGVSSCHVSPVTRHREQGIALVITLILLSVTLIMALAFLAISRRERGSVATNTDTATARLASDAALAAAEAQIVGNIPATTNAAAFNYGLLVSTNYYQSQLDLTRARPNPTNVNYLITVGSLWLGNHFLQMENLYLFPARAGVIMTNFVTRTYENRFYLDLNRNGVDDPNGSVTDYILTNGVVQATTNYSLQVGDPEWVGILEHPDAPHGPNNPAIARYAFIAVPAGNDSRRELHSQPDQDGHRQSRRRRLGRLFPQRRSRLVGNELGRVSHRLEYEYLESGRRPLSLPAMDATGVHQQGRGFEDALSLLSYRYGYNYASLAVPPANAYAALNNLGYGNIDGYTYGLLMTNTVLPVVASVANTTPWAGSDNANRFFTLDEFFNPAETYTFSTNLIAAGTNTFGGTTVPTYDRYTFYRMLDELGSDSTPESGMMNLNYDNLTVGTNGIFRHDQFLAWTPLGFFTNAADRLLKTYTAFWATNYLPTNDLADYPERLLCRR